MDNYVNKSADVSADEFDEDSVAESVEDSDDESFCDSDDESADEVVGDLDEIANQLLKHAVMCGDIDDVDKALSDGADINERYYDGSTLLFVAIDSNNINIAEHLLKNGADPNECSLDDETPLMVAVSNDNPDMIDLLFKYGCYIDNSIHENLVYGTLLSHACVSKSPSVVKSLLDNGADSDAVDRYQNTPLISTAEGAPSDQAYIIASYLLENDAVVDARGEHGSTALLYAASEHDHELVNVLTMNGADVNIQDRFGFTALMNSTLPEGEFAVVARLLINNDADVNIQNNNGKTALMLSVESNDIAMIRLLLENNADINILDNNGESALDYMRNSGVVEIKELAERLSS